MVTEEAVRRLRGLLLREGFVFFSLGAVSWQGIAGKKGFISCLGTTCLSRARKSEEVK